jgi:arylsulfatase A-like enzyme
MRYLLLLVAALTAAVERPNIVFFLIDDLGYADCGFNGGKVIKTPNIDRLAAEGAVLEHHYVQPVCSPTRAALMTGRYATRTGVYTVVRPGAKWGLPLEERTLAQALKSAGYETAITGKWHLGEFDRAYLPTSRGFDHQYGHYFGMIDYFTHVREGKMDWHRDDQPLKEEGYSTHLIAQEAVKRIASRDAAKPLFLYVPFNGVHSPFQVPDSYLKPYGSLNGSRQKLAGMLAAVDEAIGQIVAALDKAGMGKDTLIIFSSDNGGPPPGINTPLNGFKGSLWEGGTRAAAFVRWPGQVPAGKRISQPMHVIDWYPTLIGLAKGSLEQKLPIDGRDVWPMVTQGASTPHEAILSVQTPNRAAVRMGDWKLLSLKGAADDGEEDAPKKAAKKKGKVKSSDAVHVQLFNLAQDPSESTDLAAKEPERFKAMTAKLDELMKGAVPSGQR